MAPQQPGPAAIAGGGAYLDGHPKVADEALQEAKTLNDKVASKHPHFPPDLRRRLDDLGCELHALLPHSSA